MNNQKILSLLSGIECALYYRADGSDDPEGVSFEALKETHILVRKALETWHKATGCTLDGEAAEQIERQELAERVYNVDPYEARNNDETPATLAEAIRENPAGIIRFLLDVIEEYQA